MTQPPDCVPFSPIETIAIVGVGLIGGSLAAAAKAKRLARVVIGVGRNSQRLEQARQQGLIDEGTSDLGAAASRADLMVFCTPVDRIANQVREAAPRCRPGTLITDAGSVKGTICQTVGAVPASGVAFVGSHPLAGSEKQGFEFADPRLFDGRVCVVTPQPDTCRDATLRTAAFWNALGMHVHEMSPEAHDQALAETSHLPHVVAAAMAAVLDPAHAGLTATGFRDTTRIAGGDPDLWTAILQANAPAVLAGLKKYEAELRAFHEALDAGDFGRLRELLARAKTRRDLL
ncbi:MAG: prephenate dehydrogenase [Planctomycetales bacterium]